MKKLFLALMILLSLTGYVHAQRYPEWDGETGALTTGKHNIFISRNSSGYYRYQVWNAAKGIGDGPAEWQMSNGTIESKCCGDNIIRFARGDTTFTVIGYEGEQPSGMPSNAVARLFIEINGVLKDSYWLYRQY